MMLLGFCGRANHGKTTACEGIRDYALQRLGMHAEIFEISALVLDFAIKAGRLPNKKRADLTKEELTTLITVGREQRAVDESFWLDLLDVEIRKAKPGVALVPNIRYANEGRWARKSGGHIVKVACLNEDGSTFISPDRPANDPSETWADRVAADHYITVPYGHGALVEQQAITLFEYLRGLAAPGASA